MSPIPVFGRVFTTLKIFSTLRSYCHRPRSLSHTFSIRLSHLTIMGAYLLVTGSLTAGSEQLTPEEITQINTAFGITLTTQQETTLASLVKPQAPLPRWRTDAESRIENHRKSNFIIEIVDSSGNQIPNAEVDFSLTKKAFRFGGVMDLKEFSEGEANDDISITTAKYKSLFLELFDYAGLNNGLKPKLRNGNEPLLPAYFNWLSSVDLTSRGHLLMWPGNTHLTSTVEAIVADIENGNDTPQRKDDLRNQINQEITHTGDLTHMNGTTDLDHDGSNDLHEYIAGTAPTDPLDKFKPTTFTTIAENQWQLVWTSKPGKRYRIMKSTTLQNGHWTPDTGAIIPSAGETTSANINSSSGIRLFYRVEISEQ